MWGAAMQFGVYHWIVCAEAPVERSIGQLAGPWCVEGLPNTTLIVFPPSSPARASLERGALRSGSGQRTCRHALLPSRVCTILGCFCPPSSFLRGEAGTSLLPFPLFAVGSGTGARECLVETPNGPGSCSHSRPQLAGGIMKSLVKQICACSALTTVPDGIRERDLKTTKNKPGKRCLPN